MLLSRHMNTVRRLSGVDAVLAGCGREKPWHATDITGAMPRLDFAMTRANDGAP